MRLLVSVASPEDAREAVAGGADIVDAKDPGLGALGAVALVRLAEIRGAVGGARPLTAALGDAIDEAQAESQARLYAKAGASLVKIGLLGTTNVTQATLLATAAARGASAAGGGVVVVAYADASAALSIARADVIDVAARSGAHGVLLDTLDKDGPGLFGVVSPGELGLWVSTAHAAGLMVAVAGKVTAVDLPPVRDSGADVAGVRGAVCVGGRSGRVERARVQVLHECCARLRISTPQPSRRRSHNMPSDGPGSRYSPRCV